MILLCLMAANHFIKILIILIAIFSNGPCGNNDSSILRIINAVIIIIVSATCL